MNFKPPFYSPPSVFQGENIFEQELNFDENGCEVMGANLSCSLELPPRSQYSLEVLMQQGIPLETVPLTPIVSQPLNIELWQK